jgi:hypothetical protein
MSGVSHKFALKDEVQISLAGVDWNKAITNPHHRVLTKPQIHCGFVDMGSTEY